MGDILTILGRNTIGILLFHFLAYKVIFLILICLKIIPAEYLNELIPSARMGSAWLYMSIGSIVISMIMWKKLLKPGVFQVLLGGRRDFWEEIWDKSKTYYKNKKLGIYRVIKKCTVIITCFLIWGTVIDFCINYFRPVTVTFPYSGSDMISFEEGWLPQGENEPYRWIRGTGTAVIKVGKWESICISGYVPENFTDITEVKVYINENKVYEADLSESRNWEFSSDIINNYHMGETVYLEIEYNGIHVPDADAADMRELSGFVNKIELK